MEGRGSTRPLLDGGSVNDLSRIFVEIFNHLMYFSNPVIDLSRLGIEYGLRDVDLMRIIGRDL